ncbi:unnamed protein product, partial [Choristocarpus tenellus]
RHLTQPHRPARRTLWISKIVCASTRVVRQRLVRVTQPSRAWTIRGVLGTHTCVVEAGVVAVVFVFVRTVSQHLVIMVRVPRDAQVDLTPVYLETAMESLLTPS